MSLPRPSRWQIASATALCNSPARHRPSQARVKALLDAVLAGSQRRGSACCRATPLSMQDLEEMLDEEDEADAKLYEEELGDEWEDLCSFEEYAHGDEEGDGEDEPSGSGSDEVEVDWDEHDWRDHVTDERGPAFERTLRTLEWPAVCAHVASFAATMVGKRACKDLEIGRTPARTEVRHPAVCSSCQGGCSRKATQCAGAATLVEHCGLVTCPCACVCCAHLAARASTVEHSRAAAFVRTQHTCAAACGHPHAGTRCGMRAPGRARAGAAA
jgi:hypothetical protein